MSEENFNSYGSSFDPKSILTVHDSISSVDELFPREYDVSFRQEATPSKKRYYLDINPSKDIFNLTSTRPLFFGQNPIRIRVEKSGEGMFLMQRLKINPDGQPILDESELFRAEDLYYGKIVKADPNCFTRIVNTTSNPLTLELDIDGTLQQSKPHLLPEPKEIEFARRVQFFCHVRKNEIGRVFLSRNHFFKPGGIIDVGNIPIQ